jgi:hypothetical protein
MYETIILAVCLVQAPSICKEVNISVEPDPAGSCSCRFTALGEVRWKARSGSRGIPPGTLRDGLVIPTARFA